MDSRLERSDSRLGNKRNSLIGKRGAQLQIAAGRDISGIEGRGCPEMFHGGKQLMMAGQQDAHQVVRDRRMRMHAHRFGDFVFSAGVILQPDGSRILSVKASNVMGFAISFIMNTSASS